MKDLHVGQEFDERRLFLQFVFEGLDLLGERIQSRSEVLANVVGNGDARRRDRANLIDDVIGGTIGDYRAGEQKGGQRKKARHGEIL